MSKYFHPYESYFWDWEDNQSVVSIPGGSTIVYKEQLLEIINILSSDGLPVFGSLLLVMIGLNARAKQDASQVERIVNNLIDKEHGYVSKTIEFIGMLESLPSEFKSGYHKYHVLKMLFKECHRKIGYKKSKAISEFLSSRLSIQFDNSIIHNSRQIVYEDFKVVALIYRKFPTIKSILDAVTDLPPIEEDVIIEEPETSIPDSLIDQVIADSRTFKMGSLVKSLWSGLSLPFSSSQVSQQPTGGVADLNNKGDLSQLLISEYANDDIIFLSRLANSEALYLTREAPPETNDKKRVLLIDISIKNWGIPKTIGYALALAIKEHPRSKFDCEIYLVGAYALPVSMESVGEIVDALQKVNVNIDPVEGIKSFFTSKYFEKGSEIFILSEASVLGSNNMISLMGNYKNEIDYLIGYDKEGKLDLFRSLKNRQKHLQTINLSLNKLWQKKNVQRRQNSVKTALIQSDIPILVDLDYNRVIFDCIGSDHIFAMTRKSGFLKHYSSNVGSKNKGWEILDENLKFDRGLFKVGILEDKNYCILHLSTRKRRELILLNVATMESKVILVPYDFPRRSINFIFYNSSFYCKNNYKVWRIFLNGEIEIVQDDLSLLFEKQNSKLESLKPNDKYFQAANILKNIKSIGITKDKKLILNGIHELVLLENGLFMWFPRQDKRSTILFAERKNSKMYVFKNGNRVKVSHNGYLKLESKDVKVPSLYVPLTLDARSGIGIATKNINTGSKYYLKEKLFKIKLMDKGSSPLATVKVIKNVLGIGLKQAKELIDDAPLYLPGSFTHDEYIKIIKEIDDVGSQTNVENNEAFRDVIFKKSQEFYDDFILPFINSIIGHES